jgi:hypothetical protein
MQESRSLARVDQTQLWWKKKKNACIFCAWQGGDGGFQICGLALVCLGVVGRMEGAWSTEEDEG